MELFSFVVNEDSYMNESVYFMKLPRSWYDYLEGKRDEKNRYKLAIKPSSLGKKLQSIFPTIFKVNWQTDRYWLISDEKVDCELLKLICLHWFRQEEKGNLSEEMTKVTLAWEEIKLGSLLEEKEYSNFRFNSMVAFIARKFAREKRRFRVESSLKGNPILNKSLDFMHIYYNGYHECMSELIYNEQRDFCFAYVIRFKYETRGFEAEKGILNVKIGTRRFLERGIDPKRDVRWNKDGTIFVGIKNPFYERAPIQSLAPLSFEIKNGKAHWKKGENELFADVLFSDKKLNPGSILENPSDFNSKDEIIALPVFSDLVYKFYNPTRAGIGLPEKSALFDLIKNSLPELKPIPTIKEVKGWTYGHNKFPLLHSFEEGTKIMLEVWGDNRLKKQLINSLLNEEVISQESDQLYSLNGSPKVIIKFIRRDPDNIIHAIDSNSYGDDSKDRYMRKLSHHLLKIDGRKKHDFVLSLIEILTPEEYGDDDPKEAIRKGFIKKNRITQFIHPERTEEREKDYQIRLINSFYDLLTDVGFLPNHYNNLGFEGVIISLGLISGPRNLDFPILSKLDKNELKVKIFGDDTWRNFPDALLKCSSLTKREFLSRFDRENKKKVYNFFSRNVLDEVDRTDQEVVILVDHRVKYILNVFANKNLSVEKVFEKMKVSRYKDRVHFVRVNSSDEIPQYRINEKGKVGVNRQAGVFKDPINIYYTVSIRPDTMRSTRNIDLKYDYPDRHFAQQRITEFIPLSFMKEKLDEIALLAFKMRRLSIPYQFHLRVPYNLHLNNKLRKYVSFIPSTSYLSDFNEEVEIHEQLKFDFTYN